MQMRLNVMEIDIGGKYSCSLFTFTDGLLCYLVKKRPEEEKSSFEMYSKMWYLSFSSKANIIILESFLTDKGLSFSIHNKSPATLYVTRKPLQYTWWLHSVRWKTGEGTYTLTHLGPVESRAISLSGESLHPPVREWVRGVDRWGEGFIILVW